MGNEGGLKWQGGRAKGVSRKDSGGKEGRNNWEGRRQRRKGLRRKGRNI
jgi:hypothetical protein